MKPLAVMRQEFISRAPENSITNWCHCCVGTRIAAITESSHTKSAAAACDGANEQNTRNRSHCFKETAAKCELKNEHSAHRPPRVSLYYFLIHSVHARFGRVKRPTNGFLECILWRSKPKKTISSLYNPPSCRAPTTLSCVNIFTDLLFCCRKSW